MVSTDQMHLKNADAGSSKEPTWMSLPRNGNKFSIADTMESVFQLWHSLDIPLLHRSLFFGSKSSSINDGIMYESDRNLSIEMLRLQWIYRQTMAKTPAYASKSTRVTKSKLTAGLIRERFWLVKQLSHMKREERQTLYTNWGVHKADINGKRVRRKQQLVQMLWNIQGRERQSAELVLHLYSEVAGEMPLLDPRMCMIESFYAISH